MIILTFYLHFLWFQGSNLDFYTHIKHTLYCWASSPTLTIFSFCLFVCLWATLGGTHILLLDLCSGISPGELGDHMKCWGWTQIGQVEGKHSPIYTFSHENCLCALINQAHFTIRVQDALCALRQRPQLPFKSPDSEKSEARGHYLPLPPQGQSLESFSFNKPSFFF